MTGTAFQLRALADAQDALAASSDPVDCLRLALPVFAQVFGSRHACIDRQPFDGGPPRLLAIMHAEEIPEAVEKYSAYAADSPWARMIRLGGFSPVIGGGDRRVSGDVEGSGCCRTIFNPAWWRDQIGFALRLDRAVVTVLFPRERTFSGEEVRLVEEVQRCASERLLSVTNTGVADNRLRDAWRLPLDQANEPPIMPGRLHALLKVYLGCHGEVAGELPPRLKSWLAAVRTRRPFPVQAGQRLAIAVDRPQGRLHIEVSEQATNGMRVLVIHEEKGWRDFYRLHALRLTEREIEVLFWISQGKSDGDIATILGMASKTVGKHLENILLKLAAHNRTAAAVRAVEWLSDSSIDPCQIW